MVLLPRAPDNRIGRGASRTEHLFLPALTVMLASMVPILPTIATAPLLPPLGFLVMIAWRLMRREIWPAWVGVPFGLFDDLFSGQPMGSAILLWTCSLLIIEVLDRRMIWRDFRQDWGITSLLVAALLLIQFLIVDVAGQGNLVTLLPQLILSILIFPFVLRLCGFVDRFRNRR